MFPIFQKLTRPSLNNKRRRFVGSTAICTSPSSSSYPCATINLKELDSPDLDTDTKLLILTSSFPHVSQEDLLEILIGNEGSLRRVQDVLLGGRVSSIDDGAESDEETPRKRNKTVKVTTQQTSVSSFLSPMATSDGNSSNSTSTRTPLPLPKPKKGKPLMLFDPKQIEQLTPTRLITNFLPKGIADRLLSEMVQEAKSFPPKETQRFNLFENKQVFSQHTSGFFIRESVKKTSNHDADNVDSENNEDNNSYDDYGTKEWANGEGGLLYNGIVVSGKGKDGDPVRGKVRKFTPTMGHVTSLVEEKVRQITNERWVKQGGKKKFESPEAWKTNAAFVNCYDGPGENVGWHSDQLTYLGPMTAIASLSLGVGREFGIKRIFSSSEGEEGGGGSCGADGVIKIWLPHNSLLIMEAGMQEEWKHCIFASSAITPHPISGSKRINITYRCYRESLSPKWSPKCGCGLPVILRCVGDRKSVNWGRYFWSCAGAYQGLGERGQGCGYFQWGIFDENGEPDWRWDRKQKAEKEERGEDKERRNIPGWDTGGEESSVI